MTRFDQDIRSLIVGGKSNTGGQFSAATISATRRPLLG